METTLQINVEESVLKSAEDYAKERNKTVQDILNEYLKYIPKKKITLEELDDLHPDIQKMVGIIKLSDEELKKSNKELLREAKWEYLNAK